MEFELNSDRMLVPHFGQPRQVIRDRQVHETLVSLAAAPMVLPVDRKHSVAESQLCLGEVATDEVGVVVREAVSLQSLLREEQTGTAVHQQPCGLIKRDAPAIAVMVAS